MRRRGRCLPDEGRQSQAQRAASCRHNSHPMGNGNEACPDLATRTPATINIFIIWPVWK